jgi:hypothetical protein
MLRRILLSSVQMEGDHGSIVAPNIQLSIKFFQKNQAVCSSSAH